MWRRILSHKPGNLAHKRFASVPVLYVFGLFGLEVYQKWHRKQFTCLAEAARR
jgi:hypothetical protein